MKCHGTKDDHCCWLGGKQCEYLRVDGDSIACGIRLNYDNWEQAHKDPRYIRDIKPKLIAADIKNDCGDWPNVDIGQYCSICGHGVNPNEGL